MNFDLSDEQKMLLDGAERFMREAYSLESKRQLSQTDEGFSREHWQQFAELGWLALTLPEDVGGLEWSMVELALLLTTFGRGPVLEPFTSTLMTAELLNQTASEAIRQELLPQVIGGELILAFAHDDSNTAQSGPAKVLATASSSASGYTLNGHKTMVVGAASADKLIISANIDDENSPSLFLVDRDTAGVTISAYPLIDGSRAADVILDKVSVSEARHLNAASNTLAAINESIDRATLANLAESVGCMEACIDTCSDYLKTRQQFGQALGNFQSLQHIMADMFVECEEARSILYFALAQLNDTPKNRARAVSLAKVAIGEGSFAVSSSAIQLHGGYGVTDEYSVSHYFRRIQTLKKLFGDVEDHLERVADTYAA